CSFANLFASWRSALSFDLRAISLGSLSLLESRPKSRVRLDSIRASLTRPGRTISRGNASRGYPEHIDLGLAEAAPHGATSSHRGDRSAGRGGVLRRLPRRAHTETPVADAVGGVAAECDTRSHVTHERPSPLGPLPSRRAASSPRRPVAPGL